MYTNNNRRGACCCCAAALSANTVPAGKACTEPCAATGLEACMEEEGMALGQVMAPIQEYEVGFCPCNALDHGTLFPELVL